MSLPQTTTRFLISQQTTINLHICKVNIQNWLKIFYKVFLYVRFIFKHCFRHVCVHKLRLLVTVSDRHKRKIVPMEFYSFRNCWPYSSINVRGWLTKHVYPLNYPFNFNSILLLKLIRDYCEQFLHPLWLTVLTVYVKTHFIMVKAKVFK